MSLFEPEIGIIPDVVGLPIGQSRHDLDEITGLVTNIELIAKDLIQPSRQPDGDPRQGEQICATRNTCKRP